MNGQTGKVIWFNNEKGFGFISPDDKDTSSSDIFFHYSNINMHGYKTIEKEQAVKFTTKETEKGIEAQGVCLI